MALSVAPRESADLVNRFEMHYEKHKGKSGFEVRKEAISALTMIPDEMALFHPGHQSLCPDI
jgi:hypothetical protein